MNPEEFKTYIKSKISAGNVQRRIMESSHEIKVTNKDKMPHEIEIEKNKKFLKEKFGC